MVSEYAVNVKIQTDCEKFLFSGRYHMANTYIIENSKGVSVYKSCIIFVAIHKIFKKCTVFFKFHIKTSVLYISISIKEISIKYLLTLQRSRLLNVVLYPPQ